MITNGASGSFAYILYNDDDAFGAWQLWVSQNLDVATDAEKEARLKFSGYAIEIECDVASPTEDDLGCCVLH